MFSVSSDDFRYLVFSLYAVILTVMSGCLIKDAQVEEDESSLQKALYYIGGPLLFPWLAIQPWTLTYGTAGVVAFIITIAISNWVMFFRFKAVYRRKKKKLEAEGNTKSEEYDRTSRAYHMMRRKFEEIIFGTAIFWVGVLIWYIFFM